MHSLPRIRLKHIHINASAPDHPAFPRWNGKGRPGCPIPVGGASRASGDLWSGASLLRHSNQLPDMPHAPSSYPSQTKRTSNSWKHGSAASTRDTPNCFRFEYGWPSPWGYKCTMSRLRLCKRTGKALGLSKALELGHVQSSAMRADPRLVPRRRGKIRRGRVLALGSLRFGAHRVAGRLVHRAWLRADRGLSLALGDERPHQSVVRVVLGQVCVDQTDHGQALEAEHPGCALLELLAILSDSSLPLVKRTRALRRPRTHPRPSESELLRRGQPGQGERFRSMGARRRAAWRRLRPVLSS